MSKHHRVQAPGAGDTVVLVVTASFLAFSKHQVLVTPQNLGGAWTRGGGGYNSHVDLQQQTISDHHNSPVGGINCVQLHSVAFNLRRWSFVLPCTIAIGLGLAQIPTSMMTSNLCM